MRTIIAVTVILFGASAHAQECAWVADSGDRLQTIEADDWEYSYARHGAEPVNCVTIRSPERTAITCEDGTEAEVFLGTLESAGVAADVMSFDYQIFARHCV